jgi:hypothetical protein
MDDGGYIQIDDMGYVVADFAICWFSFLDN